MTELELQTILQESEGCRIEFKENLSSFDKGIVAFVIGNITPDGVKYNLDKMRKLGIIKRT